MNFLITTSTAAPNGTLVLPVFEDQEPSIQAINAIPKAIFSGKTNTFYPLIIADGESITLLVGVGKKPDYQEIKKLYKKVALQNHELFREDITLNFPDTFDKTFIEAAIAGWTIGTYTLGRHKSKDEKYFNWSNKSVNISSTVENIDQLVQYAFQLGLAQIETMKMVDLPPNIITPEYLAQWCKEAGNTYDFSVKVLGKKEAEKEQLHAFLAVNQGSTKEPQFIIAEYRGAEQAPHLGLVGKGVTFDTGGLNIKTSSMEEMKSDMAGAATVLGAIQLIAQLQLPINVTAVVPCVENAIGNQSFLPSEIIKSHSGKTIEIVDTDAEGRLILADALSYLTKNYTTDYLIDLATLTGSCIGTFGYECAALFSSSDALVQQLKDLGEETGEKVWPLPLWKAYEKEIESDVADVKNYHGKPFAGAIVAAKFLEYFTNDHPKWAHLDIAGTSFTSSEFYSIKHATAFGVHLLLKFAERLIANENGY